MANAIKRVYGKERTLADIVYNPKTKTVFAKLNMGFFGSKTVNFSLREDGCYDILVSKYNSEETVKIGQTFPVYNQDKQAIEGLTKATLGLLKRYDAVKQKEITDSSDALFITTHKLKEPKEFGTQGFKKVGYVTGVFGIEIESSVQAEADEPSEVDAVADYDDDGERIPF